jgi:uncharacterized peroxidase-related enzyme
MRGQRPLGPAERQDAEAAVAHVPFELDAEGQTATLHLARSNPIARGVPRRGRDRKEPRMTRPAPPTALDLPAAEPLDDDITAYFAKCTDKLGLIPNVLRAYAFDQAKLRAFMAMYNDLMLAPSGLSKAEREMIAVVVSSLNRCHYCLTAHGAALRQLTGDPALAETVAQTWRAAALPPRQAAMLSFAEKVTADSHRIGEADRQALREAGFTDRDIWDIAAVAGFFAMSNRMASATAMQPNPEYHGMARGTPGHADAPP